MEGRSDEVTLAARVSVHHARNLKGPEGDFTVTGLICDDRRDDPSAKAKALEAQQEARQKAWEEKARRLSRSICTGC